MEKINAEVMQWVSTIVVGLLSYLGVRYSNKMNHDTNMMEMYNKIDKLDTKMNGKIQNIDLKIDDTVALRDEQVNVIRGDINRLEKKQEKYNHLQERVVNIEAKMRNRYGE